MVVVTVCGVLTWVTFNTGNEAPCGVVVWVTCVTGPGCERIGACLGCGVVTSASLTVFCLFSSALLVSEPSSNRIDLACGAPDGSEACLFLERDGRFTSWFVSHCVFVFISGEVPNTGSASVGGALTVLDAGGRRVVSTMDAMLASFLSYKANLECKSDFKVFN